MEIRECAIFRLTRDADFEVSDEADDLLEAVQLELHRRRFGDIVRIEVADSVSPDLLERLKRGLRRRRPAGVSRLGAARPRRRDAAGRARPARAQGRALGAGDEPPVRQRAGRHLLRDRQGRHPRPPSVRLLRVELRGLRRRRGERPGRDRAEGDRVPDERRDAARPRADRGGRERQAERLSRRAEGAVRRAPQHRVVAVAGARRRPRRLRLPEPEDPRQGDARRPPRVGRAPPLRPHRHRQLPLRHGTCLRGLRAVHRRSGDRRGRGEPVQLRHRLRPAGGLPQAPGRPLQPPRPHDRRDPQGGAGGRGGQACGHPGEGEQPLATGRSSTSSTSPRRRGPRST